MNAYINILLSIPIVALLILFFLCVFYSHKIKEHRLRHATHFMLSAILTYNIFLFVIYLPNSAPVNGRAHFTVHLFF